MSGVLCYGEALIDFLQVHTAHQDGLNVRDYRQFPGGAPANASVALAKLGGSAYFAGQVGDDQFGAYLKTSLQRYGVNTEYVLTHPDAPTALAFVHLDGQGERSFTFVRNDSADLLLSCEQVVADWFEHSETLHLCSNTLTTEFAANTTDEVLKEAKKQGLVISFDVNLRSNLWPADRIDIDRVNSVVFRSDVVKFAAEEFDLLSGKQRKTFINKCFDAGCKLLLITNGAHAIEYLTPLSQGYLVPPKVNVVDTTAGGDGFIGAMLFVLSKGHKLYSLLLNTSLLHSSVAFASCAGAIAVSKQGAFPALPSLKQATELFYAQYGEQPNNLFLEQIKRELL